jgi:hypothetical protein
MMRSGDETELWFESRMHQLRLLDTSPIGLSTVIRIAKLYLPAKVQKALDFIRNPNDPYEWLDLVFKMDFILQVEASDGSFQRVGVDITSNLGTAPNKLNEILQPKFWGARRKLNVDRHWIIVVNPNALPTPEQLTDAVYTAVDAEQKCVIINLY